MERRRRYRATCEKNVRPPNGARGSTLVKVSERSKRAALKAFVPRGSVRGGAGVRIAGAAERTLIRRSVMRKTITLGAALTLLHVTLLAYVLQQERTWGGPDRDGAQGVAAAADGSVYVTGGTRSFGAGDEDAFLLKYRGKRCALVATHVWNRRRRAQLRRRIRHRCRRCPGQLRRCGAGQLP